MLGSGGGKGRLTAHDELADAHAALVTQWRNVEKVRGSAGGRVATRVCVHHAQPRCCMLPSIAE